MLERPQRAVVGESTVVLQSISNGPQRVRSKATAEYSATCASVNRRGMLGLSESIRKERGFRRELRWQRGVYK